MPATSSPHHDLPSYYAGVPLGGIGTGCLELGEDARFRNLTINNNRTAATRIPLAGNTFVAVRAGIGSEYATRIFQPDTTIDFARAGIVPPYARPGEVSWYGLYPASNYRLESDDFPLDVQWSVVAPMIPFDREASTRPLLMSVFQVTNPGDEMYSVSALFNWENLRGCSRETWPSDRGKIHRIHYAPGGEELHAGSPGSTDTNASPPLPLGLGFAVDEPGNRNEDASYCLIAEPMDGSRISYASWNKDNPDELRAVWNAFEEEGTLPDRLSSDPQAHCGSVNVTVTVSPRETRRILFVLSWHAPVYKIDGVHMGNAYTIEHRNALEVAQYGLKHAKYFQNAVSNWQQRLLQSTLPKWYARMLLNSCHVLSSNTLLTRDGSFAMMESPQSPALGVLDRSFYSSFGALLFYPDLAEKELSLLTQTPEDTDGRGPVFRDLGKGAFGRPSLADDPAQTPELCAKFILMAYRNFHLGGKLSTLIDLYPKLRQAVEVAVQHDKDRDGIPETDGDATTFGGWKTHGANSYIGGLWIAAYLAYANLARHLKRGREADRFEQRARRAAETFQQRFWDAKEQYYRWNERREDALPEDALIGAACHSAQLAGLWYADFLGLNAAFPNDRITAALDTIVARNGRPEGIALGTLPDSAGNTPDSLPEARISWPNFHGAYVACPQITHGRVDAGMDTLKNTYQNIFVRRKRTYNQSLMWDMDINNAVGPQQDRHVSALAAWHSLYALEGFWLSVPERRIIVAPKLPEGVHHLAAPLFTPVTFGWLTYQVREQPSYRQELTVVFDSPVFIETIELDIPRSITLPSVALLINEDPAPIRQQIVSNHPRSRLIITLEHPLKVQHPIEITVD